MLQVARDKLVHLGTCLGKLTHSGKFRLTVGALDILAQHAKYKVRELYHLFSCGCHGGPAKATCFLATAAAALAPSLARPAP